MLKIVKNDENYKEIEKKLLNSTKLLEVSPEKKKK